MHLRHCDRNAEDARSDREFTQPDTQVPRGRRGSDPNVSSTLCRASRETKGKAKSPGQFSEPERQGGGEVAWENGLNFRTQQELGSSSASGLTRPGASGRSLNPSKP